MKLINVAGARPNFMKIAPLMEAYKAHNQIEPLLVHTGQHYDQQMSELFFTQLEIPEPDINLGVGSASHAVQTAEIMKAFEPVVAREKPDVVLVVGDVNSTIACGLVAVKMSVKLVHVEAGLRSFDRDMPEEINRLLTDAISDLLFCTEKSGVDNLAKEGIPSGRIHFVGNVMIDTLLRNQTKAEKSTVLRDLQIEPGRYAALTLHRPSNVDNPEVFARLLDALEKISNDMEIIFPIHPRTRKNIERMGLQKRVGRIEALRLVEPMGYLDFLKLMSEARLVLTDSGGIQEETTILKVPCLTLRQNTERPVTVEVGCNQVTGTDPARIIEAYERIKDGLSDEPDTPPLWDGRAAERIAKIMLEKIVD